MTPDDASLTGTLRSPARTPASVHVLRVLLYVVAGLSFLVMLGFLLAVPLPPGETVGRALWGVWPGVVAYVLAEQLRRPSRLVHRLVLALGAYLVLRSLALLGDGDPRGWTTLALPVAVIVLASRRSARQWFGRAPARRPLTRGRTDEQGTTAVEYVAILALVAVVAAAAVGAVSSQQAALQGFRGVVCAVFAGPGCDPGTSIGAEPAAGGIPPGPSVQAPVGEEGCRGFGDCAAAFGGQVLGGVGGVGGAIWDEVTGVWGLVTDPAGIIDAGAYIWENPGDAARQLVWDDASAEGWAAGNYGEAVGRTVWNVGSWLIPGYNVGKAGSVFGDAGRVARLGGDVAGQVDEVSDLARQAAQAAAAGDLDDAAELAARARQGADDLEDRARRSGCLTAGVPAAPVRVFAMGGGGLPGGSAAVVRAASCDDARAAADEAQRLADEAAAAAGARVAVNAAGVPYPLVTDLRTGSPISYPGDGLSRVPVAERVTWNAQDRGAFIKEWYDRGFETPPGGWAGYDIHHVQPREYGGTNDFDNLVPVPRDIHQQQFNPWWANYGD